MAISKKKWQDFTPNTVAKVPATACVYELGDRKGNTVKYGKSDTSCQQRVGQQLGTAERFRWQPSRNPGCDEATLIADYRRRTGRLPKGNKVQPSTRSCSVSKAEGGSGGLAALLGVVAVGAILVGLIRSQESSAPRIMY